MRSQRRSRRRTLGFLVGPFLLAFMLVFGLGGAGVPATAHDETEPEQLEEIEPTSPPSPQVGAETDGTTDDSASSDEESDDGESGDVAEHEQPDVSKHEDEDAEDVEAGQDGEAEHVTPSPTPAHVSGTVGLSLSASVTTVPPEGGDVTFTVEIRNDLNVEAAISSLASTPFGHLAGGSGCAVGTTIPAKGSCSFTFTEDVSGEADTEVKVAVWASLDVGEKVKTAADAVLILVSRADHDRTGKLAVSKTADRSVVVESGAEVVFSFEVKNLGHDDLTITSIDDDVFGSLAGDDDCREGAVLAPGADCSFTVTELLSGTAGTEHVNTVTVTASTDHKEVVAHATETVAFVEAIETGRLEVTKSADVDSVVETGDDVTFTFDVRNSGHADVTITSIDDDVFGSLAGDEDCRLGTTLTAGAGCSFTLTTTLSGPAGTHHRNVVTVKGETSGEVTVAADHEKVVFVAAQGPGPGPGPAPGPAPGPGEGGQPAPTQVAGLNLGARAQQQQAPVRSPSGQLAFTGPAAGAVLPIAGAAAVMLIVGTTMLAIARRRGIS